MRHPLFSYTPSLCLAFIQLLPYPSLTSRKVADHVHKRIRMHSGRTQSFPPSFLFFLGVSLCLTGFSLPLFLFSFSYPSASRLENAPSQAAAPRCDFSPVGSLTNLSLNSSVGTYLPSNSPALMRFIWLPQ